MRRLLESGLLILLGAAAAMGQDPPRIYTQPVIPAREVLDRLNLTVHWQAAIPAEGRKDGLLSVQFSGKHLFVQTRSGLVTMLNAESGRAIWRTRVGIPYASTLPVAFNSHSVYVINNASLYSMDRATGIPVWQYRLPAAAAAPLVVDDTQLFLAGVNTRLYAFQLPDRNDALFMSTNASPPVPGSTDAPSKPAYVPSAIEEKYKIPTGKSDSLLRGYSPQDETGPGPVLEWEMPTGERIDLRPLLTPDTILVPGYNGVAVAYVRLNIGNLGGSMRYRFQTDGDLLAEPGQFGETAYIGSKDTFLYALDIPSQRMEWRYTAGSAITQQPIALENEVYVVGEKTGLARLNRATGEALWRVPRGSQLVPAQAEAQRFLAANAKFVYALDRIGRMLVLDRARGTILSYLDARDWVVPISNALTDRVYLGAHNGLIVCLRDRDRDYLLPYRHRKMDLKEAEAGKTLTERVRDLDEKLKLPISEMGGEAKKFKDFLDEFAKKYGLKISFSDATFIKEGLAPISDKPVQMPKVDMIPLRDVFKQILNDLKATYDIAGDIIFVLPNKGKPAEGMGNPGG